ncbi:MAG TPA: DUF190 domain-containing protein [Acidimicrobiales bacterium]|nr:DUF190 domain-containing protein [Acidimicrobiales bacterium]
MSATDAAVRLTVFTTEAAVAPGGRALHLAVLELARQRDIAGATVLRGVEGFGASRRLLSTRFPDLAAELPLVVEIVDRAERIEAFLPDLLRLTGDELVVSQTCTIDSRLVTTDPPRSAPSA